VENSESDLPGNQPTGLSVADLDQAIGFDRDVLGFREVDRVDAMSRRLMGMLEVVAAFLERADRAAELNVIGLYERIEAAARYGFSSWTIPLGSLWVQMPAVNPFMCKSQKMSPFISCIRSVSPCT